MNRVFRKQTVGKTPSVRTDMAKFQRALTVKMRERIPLTPYEATFQPKFTTKSVENRMSRTRLERLFKELDAAEEKK
jgi:hypothetical protein